MTAVMTPRERAEPAPKKLSRDERRVLRKALRASSPAGGGGLLTSYERARLRLDAWKALDGWGVSVPLADDATELDKHFRPRKPWNWEERKTKADDLYEWLIQSEEQEQ
jgi:hypothetical protein